ncbi:MAG: type II toxin-antitoxin system VapB family antitoxin [Planctomycetes bacterium]|nr:type II toxin-antitoxin system VapB family antitoxin [Planctomycetota bacterium]
MATNLDLDDRLITKAKRLGHHRSKKDAVTAALETYVRHLGQLRILESFGTVDFNPKFDYKAARLRARH